MSTGSSGPSTALYRTFWRWHFYAGLFVLPFLLILAVTGAIYLFNDEINDALFPDQRFATSTGSALPLERLIGAATVAFPDTLPTRIDVPEDPRRTAQVFLTPAAGAPFRVYVDRQTAEVKGHFVYERTLVGFADVMHGSLMLGKFGDAIVELAASWGLVQIVTGLVLWFPRRAKRVARLVSPDFSARGRGLWRELHAVGGAWTAVLILFLIVTGLPWSNLWGSYLQAGANALGIGYPASYRRYDAPDSVSMKQALGTVPWTLEGAPLPRSLVVLAHASGDHHETTPAAPRQRAGGLGPTEAAAILARNGMTAGYRLFLPQTETGVFTAYTYPDRPQGQRTLHIDRNSGAVLGDIGFADYGWAAKAVELGVQLHMGNYFGRANQLLMLATCLAVIGLSVTGVVMWWIRRPRGRLGAPHAPAPAPAGVRTVILVTFGLGLVLPLVACTFLLALLIDRLVLPRLRGHATRGP